MPTYPLINKITGEKKELSMSMKAYDEWRAANPDWDQEAWTWIWCVWIDGLDWDLDLECLGWDLGCLDWDSGRS